MHAASLGPALRNTLLEGNNSTEIGLAFSNWQIRLVKLNVYIKIKLQRLSVESK